MLVERASIGSMGQGRGRLDRGDKKGRVSVVREEVSGHQF